jgi:N-acetylglucosaminyl-diphospho-decaprenol L-rhamnosyltransferase
MPAVSVIIVSWNPGDHLFRCLEPLVSSSREIVVVDNASADGTADRVASRFPGVILIRARLNLGFPGAVNLASRRASGEYLLLLGSDVAVSAGTVDALAAFLEANPRCGAVTARPHGVDGPTGWGPNLRRFPTFMSVAVDLLLVDRLWPRNPFSRRYLALDVSCSRGEVLDVEQPAAACLMLRRSAFEAAGRMDEAFYPAWFDDVDLCRRLRSGGWRISMLCSALFSRTPGVARRQLGRDTFTRIWYRNLQRYVRKHHGLAGLAVVKALIVAGMMERILICILRNDGAGLGAYRRVLFDTFRPAGFTRLMDQLAAEPGEHV